jgi:hypothetical protein
MQPPSTSVWLFSVRHLIRESFSSNRSSQLSEIMCRVAVATERLLGFAVQKLRGSLPPIRTTSAVLSNSFCK